MAAVLLRRSIATAGLATIAILASPLVGTSLAVDPALNPGTFTPSNGSTVKANRPAISVSYNTALNTSHTTIAVTDTTASNAAVSCAPAFSNADKTVGCKPAADLTDGHTYKVAVHAVNHDRSNSRNDSATWTVDIPSLVPANTVPAPGKSVVLSDSNNPLVAAFDEQIYDNSGSTHTSTFRVSNSIGNTVPGSVGFQSSGGTFGTTDEITFTPSQPLNGGHYTATIHVDGVNGSADNRAAFDDVTYGFWVKSAAPVVQSHPQFINNANNGAVPFKGTAAPGLTVSVLIHDPNDNQSAFDDGSGSTTVATCGASAPDCPWEVDVDASAMPSGDTDTWTATASDANGNDSASATGSITVDESAPAPPSVTTSLAAGSTDLTVSATDSSSDVTSYSIKVSDQDGHSLSSTADAAGNNLPQQHIDVSSLTDGTLSVVVQAVDNAGNVATAPTAKPVKDVGLAVDPNTSSLASGGNNVSLAQAESAPIQPPTSVTIKFGEPIRLDWTDSSGPNAASPVHHRSTVCVADTQGTCINDGPTVTADGMGFTVGTSGLHADGPYKVSYTNIWPKNFCPDLSGPTPQSQDSHCDGASGSIIAPGSNPASTFVVDGTPPGVPTVTMPSTINGKNVSQVPISGTADVGSTITGTIKSSGGGARLILNGGQPITVGSDGKWQDQEDLSNLNDGTLTVSVFATDSAGNKSAAGHPHPAPVDRAHPKFATQLTAKTSAKAVTFGKSIRLSGRLVRKTSQSGLVGATVKITPVFDNGAKGKTIVIHTGNFGNWSKRLHPHRNASYVAAFPGDARDKAVSAHTTRTVVRVNIHFTSPKNGSHVGATVTLKGVVAPNKAGKLVSIYRHTSGGNTLVGTAKLTSKSTFSFKMSVPPGTTQVFAKIGKTKNNAGNRSGLLTLHH